MIIFSSDNNFETIYRALKKSEQKIEYLITECPKPKGRGLMICQNPAHSVAAKVKIKTLTPDRLDEKFVTDLKKIILSENIELGLVSAYGKILPQELIDIFPRGILNIHPSLLPKFRGATPIASAILEGETETGFTIMKVVAKCDCGPIVAQKRVTISPDDNHTTLKAKIFSTLENDLPDIIEKYLSGKISLTPQDERHATTTKKINKADGRLTQNDTAVSAARKIRALNEWPRAFLVIGEKRFIINEARLAGDKLEILKIQPEGKKSLSFDDFRRGYTNLLTKFPKFVRI
jgi:methionyl-tRNA formyltransferase